MKKLVDRGIGIVCAAFFWLEAIKDIPGLGKPTLEHHLFPGVKADLTVRRDAEHAACYKAIFPG